MRTTLLLLCFSTPALTTMSALPCEPQSMEWFVCLDIHTHIDRQWCETEHGWEGENQVKKNGQERQLFIRFTSPVSKVKAPRAVAVWVLL
jgi:hypothetical protein